jgi:hypothetical protein
MHEKLNWMFSGTAQFSHQVCQIFVSSVSLLVRVTMVDTNKTVVCCLLDTSAIILSEKKKRKRKMWSKKWSLEGNISCDAHLLNELLETDVNFECLEMMPSWCRQVNWGNCGILWVNCAVLCAKDDWKDSSEACAISCQNCTVYSVFPSRMKPHNKIVQFSWECIGRYVFGNIVLNSAERRKIIDIGLR